MRFSAVVLIVPEEDENLAVKILKEAEKSSPVSGSP